MADMLDMTSQNVPGVPSAPYETVDETVFPLQADRCVPLTSIEAPRLNCTFQAQFCEFSNIAFLSQRPKIEFYEEFYAGTFHENLEQRLSRLQEKTLRRFAMIADVIDTYQIDLPAQPRMLDVGCGAGIFGKEFRSRFGGSVYGVEPDDNASAIAGRNGVTVLGRYLGDVAEETQAFDVITMIHVLEHMLYPKKELLEIRELIKPDGKIIIQVPDLDAVLSLGLHHVFQYTPRAAMLLLREVGLKAVGLISTQWPDRRGNPRHRKNLSIVATLDSDTTLPEVPLPPAKSLEQIRKQHVYWRRFGKKSRIMRRLDRLASRFRRP